ncbi:MAG: hypothetical protein RBU21_09755 [FCB group bacterium]|jgi:hypothetical protein|nr:hypothetical protein [FCB group bacterium]
MSSFFARHWILTTFLGLIVLFVVLVAGVIGYRMKGPYRSYAVDFVKPAKGEAVTPGALEVGAAKVDITPDLAEYDPWTDVDGNGRYKAGVDTYVDANNNGKFDAVWMAGFNNDRPAQKVHDPLWARAIAVRNNGVTVAMVSIDSIGIMHEKFIAVRKSIDPSLNIDHVIFSCTHNHEAPDTMGLWSNHNIDSIGSIYKVLFNSNFDHKYLAKVQAACKQAAEEAVKSLQPADMTLGSVKLDVTNFVDDSRLPLVYDKMLNCARFVKQGTDETIATLVSAGNHAETLGGDNVELTSDFCHYLREGMEKGVAEPNGAEGFGGICVYYQGMVGGLMTQLHTTVPHRDGTRSFREDTWEKAEALGENYAIEAIKVLRGPTATKSETAKVAVAAKTFYAKMEGPLAYAMALGIIHPGWYWGKARSEIDAVRIGDLEILTIPGELYPEIAEGGIEAPDGQDFALPAMEVPPLRGQMKGKVNVIMGLANDEIGYIIPKSQWDVKPPYAYGRDKPQYGEVNSGGPDVAPTVHEVSMETLARLHEVL